MRNTKDYKNEIIFLYKRQKLQEELFPQDVLALKEFIFNDKIETPELCKPQPKKIKLSTCFFIEPKTEDLNIKPRSASTIKPNKDNKNFRKNSNFEYEEKNLVKNNYFNKNNLRENQENNTCNNFCKNSNRKCFNVNEFFLCRENSISFVNQDLIEYNRNDKVVNLNNDLGFLLNFKNENKNYNDDKVIIKGRKFSEVSSNSTNSQNQDGSKINTMPNAEKNLKSILNHNQEISQKLTFSEYLEKSKIINNLNINNIYKINEFLGMPKDQLLWYIYQPLTKSSVGPISSLSLEEMLKDNNINLESQIRLIDIYSNKKNNFSYIKLKDLNDLDHNYNNLNDINLSSLINTSLKGNKFYKVRIHLNKDSEFESLEMIKKIEMVNKIDCPIDLESKQNLRSLVNKASPSLNKQMEQANNTLLTNTPNNLFNKSNKIEKGVHLLRNNANNFSNSAATPVKTDSKVITIDIDKLTKGQISPIRTQDSISKIDQSSSALNYKNDFNKKAEVEVSKKNDSSAGKVDSTYKNEKKNQIENKINNNNNNFIEVVIVNKENNYNEKSDFKNSNRDYNHQDYQNKPYNRRYSKGKRGSLPPKKSGFNYDYYEFDENKGYYGENNYDNNNNYKNKNYGYNKNYNKY